MSLPTSAVGQQAIKTALGTSESGVIALCQSTKINKWSGTKPFRSSATSFTYAELVAALKAANYGLNIQGDSTAAAALNRAAGSSEIWPYLRPQGTSGSPYRQGDFRGYNHSAPVPYSAAVTANNGTTGLSNASFEFDVDQASGAEVLAAQMTAVKNGKWVLLWRISGGSTSVVNGANVSSASYPFSLTVEALGAQGTYEACAAILYNNTYYVVPNTYKTFQIAFVAPSLTLVWNVVEWNALKTEVSFEVAVRNNGNSAQQVMAHTITLRETLSVPQTGIQPSGSSPASFTSSAVTVPAKSTVIVKTGKFTGITYNQARQYFVTFSGPQFTYEYTAIDEPEEGSENQ